MTIYPIDHTDEDLLEACAALRASASQNPHTIDRAWSHLRTLATTPGFVGLVAYDRGQVVGFLLGRLSSSAKPRANFILTEIFVSAEPHRPALLDALASLLNRSVHRMAS